MGSKAPCPPPRPPLGQPSPRVAILWPEATSWRPCCPKRNPGHDPRPGVPAARLARPPGAPAGVSAPPESRAGLASHPQGVGRAGAHQVRRRRRCRGPEGTSDSHGLEMGAGWRLFWAVERWDRPCRSRAAAKAEARARRGGAQRQRRGGRGGPHFCATPAGGHSRSRGLPAFRGENLLWTLPEFTGLWKGGGQVVMSTCDAELVRGNYPQAWPFHSLTPSVRHARENNVPSS